jgi:hypothetical protein
MAKEIPSTQTIHLEGNYSIEQQPNREGIVGIDTPLYTFEETVASELITLAKDTTRPIGTLRGIVQAGLPKTASQDEARKYIQFFERLKRITEAAYLSASEVGNARL